MTIKIIHKILYCFLLFKAFLLCVNTTYALEVDDIATDELYKMELNQLINLEVSVASINSESILETPAVVSSYASKDLEKLGLRTLRDMLSFIPGLSIQSSNTPADSIMLRGVSETFNQKILLLIDNVPYWGSSHSQIPLLGIPLEAIERIEVIRGPGAVIYGTNASAGAIKVVTKNAANNSSLAVRVGSHKHKNAGGFVSKSFSEDVNLNVAFEFQKEDGYKGYFENNTQVAFLPANQETSGTIREKMEMNSILAKLNVGNLELMAQAFESIETGSLGAAPTHPIKPADAENRGYLLHAHYKWFFDNTQVNAYSDYNMSDYEAYEKNFNPGVERLVKFDNSGKDKLRSIY